ncbi:MAG: DUF4364 family protein [Clostridia bacterium]|nr:DUF4364 family protein [Clostridia bacterium]
MKLDSDNTALAENKVLILYLLEQINNEITEDGLYKIVSSTNNINYFYYKQVLTDLIDSKLVGTYTKDENALIKITSEGKNALSLTKEVLPGIVKLKADNIFKQELLNIEKEASVIAEYTPKSENDYTIKCKIVENNETIFEVKTFAGSRERAKRIVDNWNKNAQDIYPEILNLLLNDKK